MILLGGSDYNLPKSFEVFYPVGSEIGTQKCANIVIFDDDTLEGTHNFTINLVDPGNPCCNVVFPSTIQIDILDNEGQRKCVWVLVRLCVCMCVRIFMYVSSIIHVTLCVCMYNYYNFNFNPVICARV